jgi:two-component system, OmpR family, alkaline phosphatase synthesis response regulator PhoP
MSYKILIVEDDQNLSHLLKYNLEQENFNCDCIFNGSKVLKYLKDNKPDIILMDIMLPDLDGFEVSKQIKKDPELQNTPIIILSAKNLENDKTKGFEIGADDYVTKPFSPKELILRIKAILKRTYKLKTKEDNIVSFKDLKINLEKHEVRIEENLIFLTSKEFKLLLILLKNKGRVLTREKLLSKVWNIEADITTRTIDSHIKKLRKKLLNYGEMIETVRSIGYKFKE